MAVSWIGIHLYDEPSRSIRTIFVSKTPIST
jgi:hypothetical protein